MALQTEENPESTQEESEDVTVVPGQRHGQPLKPRAAAKTKCTAKTRMALRLHQPLVIPQPDRPVNNMAGESLRVQVGNHVIMKRPSLNTRGSKTRDGDVKPTDSSAASTLQKGDLPITRSMRYAFKTYFHLLDIQVQHRYNELKSSNMVGKQAMMDEIIWNSIPKGGTTKFRATTALWTRSCETKNLNYRDTHNLGITYTEMKAKLGGDAAIQEGLARKDIYIGTDNMYYLKRVAKGHKHTFEDHTQIEATGQIDGHQDCELRKFEMLANVEDWMLPESTELGSGSSGSTDVPSTGSGSTDVPSTGSDQADTELMENVQRAFDMATRLTLSVKKILQDMTKRLDLSTSDARVQHGIELCKAMVPSSEEIELYLLTPVQLLDRSRVASTLEEAAKHFKALDVFRAEVATTLRECARVKRIKQDSV